MLPFFHKLFSLKRELAHSCNGSNNLRIMRFKNNEGNHPFSLFLSLSTLFFVSFCPLFIFFYLCLVTEGL